MFDVFSMLQVLVLWSCNFEFVFCIHDQFSTVAFFRCHSYSFCMEKLSNSSVDDFKCIYDLCLVWAFKSLNSKPFMDCYSDQLGNCIFEYCFQVPGNRLGSQHYTLPQLKILQELITLSVFMGFAYFYMDIKPTMNYLWASLCLLAAVFFIFRSWVLLIKDLYLVERGKLMDLLCKS